MKYIPLLTLVCFLFAGCATDPGAKIAQHNIRTVGVEKRVNAGSMRYSEIHAGAPNAGLTGLIVDATRSREIKQMTDVMQEHGIDVPGMVRSNFVQAVNQIGYEYSEDRPDATFVLRLSQYGFDQKSFFSSVKVPFLVIHGQLVTAEGKVIWRGNSQNENDALLGRASNTLDRSHDEMGVAEWEDYERDPDKLRADWEVAVHNAVVDLLRAARRTAGN
jgi:hypothetical protein